MKRTLVMVCALAASIAGSSAWADAVYTGAIHTAVLHPAVPRALYLEHENANGIAGYVLPIGYSQEARTFELRRVSGATEREDLDAWFYRDIYGTGDPCPRVLTSHTPSLEIGEVCPGAAFAVVVLFTGADATFELTIGS